MKRFLFLALSIALVLCSCGSPGKAGEAAGLVSADAYAALVAESPLKLYKSADAFFDAAGIERVADGKSLAEKLKDLSRGDGKLADAAAVLDFGKPVALVIAPGEDAGSLNAVLWLPLRGGRESYNRLMAALESFRGESGIVDGYAVLSPNGKVPTALPSKTADLARLETYPRDSVQGWINVTSLRRDFGDGWYSALPGAFKTPPALPEAQGEEAPAPGVPYNYNERKTAPEGPFEEWDAEGSSSLSAQTAGGAAGIAALLAKVAANVDTLDFAVGADKRGFYARFGATVPDGTVLGDLAASAGPERGLPYLKYVESDALVGGVSSIDPSAFSGLVKLYMEALGMNEYLGQGYYELLESAYKAQGTDSAFSFDFSMAPEFLQNAGGAQTPEEISDLIKRSFSFKVSGVGAVRDKELYRETLKSLGSSDIFGNAFKELLDSSGLELGFSVQEGSVDGIDYDEIRVSLGGPVIEGNPESKAMLASILDMLTLYSGYANGRAYMVLGDSRILSEAVSRDGAISPLSSDKGYKNFASILPKGTRGVWYLSLRRIYELVGAFAPGVAGRDPAGLDKLFGYVAADKGEMEAGIFLGAEDIGAVIGMASEAGLF